jgi:hypothetical protein
MSKIYLVIISLLALLVAAAAGYFCWGTLHSTVIGPACPHSTIANMALPVVKDPIARQKIESLDAAFTASFNQTCGQLCQERVRLSARLNQATPEDPESLGMLATITRLQSEIERSTWNHLLAVRDAMPAPERAEFVRKVQAQWVAGQRHMQKSMAEHGQCPMHEGK